MSETVIEPLYRSYVQDKEGKMKAIKLGYDMLHLVCALSAWLGYLFYVFIINGTSHTGYNLKKLAVVYIIWGVIGLVLWLFQRSRWFLLSAIVCALAAVNILLFDYFEIMMHYQDWVRRGLNIRTFGCWFVDCA